jgi:ketosteroid isomerase-like protein
MSNPQLKAAIEACDRAISQEDYATLMAYYAEDAVLVVKPGMVVRGKENIRKAFVAIADYFQHRLVVTQGKMEIIEGAGNALVIMETRQLQNDRWLCSVDNSYGTDLLDQPPV